MDHDYEDSSDDDSVVVERVVPPAVEFPRIVLVPYRRHHHEETVRFRQTVVRRLILIHGNTAKPALVRLRFVSRIIFLSSGPALGDDKQR
jgi:hypothetical protein